MTQTAQVRVGFFVKCLARDWFSLPKESDHTRSQNFLLQQIFPSQPPPFTQTCKLPNAQTKPLISQTVKRLPITIGTTNVITEILIQEKLRNVC